MDLLFMHGLVLLLFATEFKYKLNTHFLTPRNDVSPKLNLAVFPPETLEP